MNYKALQYYIITGKDELHTFLSSETFKISQHDVSSSSQFLFNVVSSMVSICD